MHIFAKKIRYADGKYDLSVHYSSVDGIYKGFSHANITLKRIIMEKKKCKISLKHGLIAYPLE